MKHPIDRNNRLSDLGERIRVANLATTAAGREMAERVLEAGSLLIEAKADCPHGAWLPFLERAGIAERQAQRLMTLSQSGLKSNTVSDLGIKGALELANKRKLPEKDEVLIAWVGQPLPSSVAWPDPELLLGEITAYVYESAEMPGRMHVVGWNELVSESVVTLKGFPRDRPDIVFMAVDQVLEGRQAEMQIERKFSDNRLAMLVDTLHRVTLQDIIDDPQQAY